MAANESPQPSFSRSQRWMIALNMVLAVAAALALVVMLNYLAGGYFKRFQWSRDAAFKLSPQTLHVLDALTNVVDVTIYFEPNGGNQQIYDLTKSLLGEYQRTDPKHIRVKTLDYSRYVGEAKEFLSKYHLTGLQDKDFVLFDANGHHKIIYARDLAQYDFSDLLSGRSKYVRRSSFRGETFFTGCIYAVIYPQPGKAYFLYGHGENDPGTPGEDNSRLGPAGYSKLASILKEEINCDWDRLSLLGTNDVPADCQLLIIAGPREGKFPPEELGKISAYLKQGGRLLALLTKECGVEEVLTNWGVAVANTRVIDTNAKYTLPPDGLTFFAAQLVPHPIINPLASEKMSIRMVYPRPVYKLDEGKVPGGPDASYLALTSEDGVDEQKRRAVYPLLVAVEQGVVNGVNSPRGEGTRMVVAGDSDFLDDEVIDSYAGNHYFAGLALNWLLERPQIVLAGLRSQPIKEYQFYMTHGQTRAVQFLFLGGMPGVALLVGGLVWLRRRN